MSRNMLRYVFTIAVYVLLMQECIKAETIRFASWNIGHFALGRGCESNIAIDATDARGVDYRRFLDAVNADFIGIAEYSHDFASNGSVKAPDMVFRRYAKRVIGPQHTYQWNAQFWNDGEFVETRTKYYRKHDQRVYYVATRIRIGGREVVFVQTHLDWRTMLEGHEDDRADQMRTLIADFQNERRVVIAGDFNVGIRADGQKTLDNPEEYKVFEEAGFVLGNDGHHKTYPAGRTEYAYDNIIVKGMRLSGFRVVDCPELSDHTLVVADLEFYD